MTKITLNNRSPIMINSDKELKSCIQHLEQSTEIAVDLEFDKNRLRYGFSLCLIQIFNSEACYIIDPLSKDLNVSDVFPLFENPNIVKVVFAFGEDLKLLLSLGCQPKNVYDLATLSRLMDFPAMSLTNLLNEKIGIETSKSSQLSDWFKRPLSDKQISYAADDVLHLLDLKKALENDDRFELIAPWFREECKLIEAFSYEPSEEVNAFLKRKDKIKMTEYEWFVFEKLMRYRDQLAKSFKRPPHFMMPTDLVKEIVAKPDLLNNWMTLPRLFKRIKNKEYQKKMMHVFYEADKETKILKLSKTKTAIPSLTLEDKQKNRQKRNLEEKVKNEIFKPIQQEIIKKWGENTSNFIFSNRVINDVILKKEKTLLPYRKDIVRKIAKELNLDVDEYLAV